MNLDQPFSLSFSAFFPNPVNKSRHRWLVLVLQNCHRAAPEDRYCTLSSWICVEFTGVYASIRWHNRCSIGKRGAMGGKARDVVQAGGRRQMAHRDKSQGFGFIYADIQTL